MTVIAFGFVILSALVLFRTLFAWNTRQARKQRTGILTSFSRLGSSHNLSFTSQELLADRIIGFDGLSKKLLVLEKRNGLYDWFTIDMSDVESCTVRKVYIPSTDDNLASMRLHEPVLSIALHFTFKKGDQPVAIPFYTNGVNDPGELKMLEVKAKGWESFLAKLLTHNQPGRA